MKSQVQFFLDGSDEQFISTEMVLMYPDLIFIDGSVWESSPVVKPSISDCESGLVYIWDRSIVSEVPSVVAPGGMRRGPQVGPVIQVVRSVIKSDADLLCSGSFAHSTMPGLEELDSRYRALCGILKARSSRKVYLVDKSCGSLVSDKAIDAYYVGSGARNWLSQKKGRLLKSRSSEHYYSV